MDSPRLIDGYPPQLDPFNEVVADVPAEWTTVYDRFAYPSGGSCGLFTYFIETTQVTRALRRPMWDRLIGRDRPTLEFGDDDEYRWQTVDQGSTKPLVMLREFDGNQPVVLEIAEDFRLAFNLFSKTGVQSLFSFDESGNEFEAVRINGHRVEIKTSLLSRYQAARQLAMVTAIDSCRGEPEDVVIDPPHSEEELRGDGYVFSFATAKRHGDCAFTHLIGKRVKLPPPMEKSGFAPFYEANEYEEFIVDVDEHGKNVTMSCDPGIAEHSYRPVTFKKSVLDKYVKEPSKYEINSGSIRCKGSWMIQADTNHPDYVTALLIHLGQMLSYDEQKHWRSHNIAPAKSVSETYYRNAIMGEFAQPDDPIFRLRNEYDHVNEKWQARWGWPLFSELDGRDKEKISQLHIPTTDEHSEFDDQVARLALFVVDHLNDKAIVGVVGKSDDPDERSIAKLARLLESCGADNRDEIVRNLRDVQKIRSRSAAHKKSKDLDVLASLDATSLREAFGTLIDRAMSAIVFLDAVAPSKSDSDGKQEPPE